MEAELVVKTKVTAVLALMEGEVVLELPIENTTPISVLLTDDAGDPITTGTVDVSLTDLRDTAVTGQTWPHTLVHSGSGEWAGTLSKALNLKDRRSYRLKLHVVSGSIDETITYDARAKIRTY